jgi:hypothetical protein
MVLRRSITPLDKKFDIKEFSAMTRDTPRDSGLLVTLVVTSPLSSHLHHSFGDVIESSTLCLDQFNKSIKDIGR